MEKICMKWPILFSGKNKKIITNSLRKHAYSNILKIVPPKNENLQTKNSDIFQDSAQNIDCEYSLLDEAVLTSTRRF